MSTMGVDVTLDSRVSRRRAASASARGELVRGMDKYRLLGFGDFFCKILGYQD